MVNPAEWAGVKKTETHEKYLIKLLVTSINVVFQFYPWFKFYFPLFQTHCHTLPYPKTKENKIYTKDKIDARRTTESDSKRTDLFYSYQFFLPRTVGLMLVTLQT